MREIDMVIPYVNNQDEVWRRNYLQYFARVNYKKLADMRSARYEDIGLIYYNLRLIEKNMPFIRTIYLLLSNKEQVNHKLLPSKVKVIYHNEFIPLRFLPTFNSTTIEMFLHNIKGLSEYFIYANDDMLPVGKLKEDDFFSDDGKIKMNYRYEKYEYNPKNPFRKQCLNSYQHVSDLVGLGYGLNEFIKPDHSITPMIKSHCKYVVETLGDTIYREIRSYRTHEQHNQYIYINYEIMTNNCLPSLIDFFYTEFQSEEELETFTNHQIVCLNIIPKEYNTQVIEKLESILCE